MVRINRCDDRLRVREGLLLLLDLELDRDFGFPTVKEVLLVVVLDERDSDMMKLY